MGSSAESVFQRIPGCSCSRPLPYVVLVRRLLYIYLMGPQQQLPSPPRARIDAAYVHSGEKTNDKQRSEDRERIDWQIG